MLTGANAKVSMLGKLKLVWRQNESEFMVAASTTALLRQIHSACRLGPSLTAALFPLPGPPEPPPPRGTSAPWGVPHVASC